MDRVAAMVIFLGVLLSTCLFLLALFSIAPMFCSCLIALVYILIYFLFNEDSEIHHAQEFENRFWTLYFALLVGASIYVKDSPLCFGDQRPYLGGFIIVVVGYGVHTWDRMIHRKVMSQQVVGLGGLRRGASAAQSLVRLNAMGLSVEDQLERISVCMANIDQLLVPSTINNFINQQFILRNEREIISIFEDAQPKALNWLISHVKLALVFYKIKDHRNFRGQHRTALIELLAVDRVSVLTVVSRVLLLRALQLMKLSANPRAEHWVRNIILFTHQDELSELKTMTDSKGDYFCMKKLIFEDIRSETVRQDILSHFRKEAAVQQAHLDMGTRRANIMKKRQWRKILSDVDDTLTCSGGSYPAGVDKRYGKHVVYPGVIGLYRELDLGINGPDEFPPNTVGNLVFLSARPHLYKDISEKHNFAKFDKLRQREGVDGRGGLHTIPSLLTGDLTSGREFVMTGDFEPLARKKFDNFRKYVSIYPEYKHVFICDNGQGDVRAGELMYDHFSRHFDRLFVHLVKDLHATYGFEIERWRKKGLLAKTCFFTTYPDAAMYAAMRMPPLIRMNAFWRICQDAVEDFKNILPSQWTSESQKRERQSELNQSLWRCNIVLTKYGQQAIPLIESPRKWEDGEKVQTSFGAGIIMGFDSIFDLYDVELDWRPLDEQVKDLQQDLLKKESETNISAGPLNSKFTERNLNSILQTVEEEDENHYLSPSTSFNHSSKNSLDKIEQNGKKFNTLEDEQPTVIAQVVDDFASSLPSLKENVKCKNSGMVVSQEMKSESVSSTSILVKEETGQRRPISANLGRFRASIQGRKIKKYCAPTLPKLKEDKNRSKFSFWSSDNIKGAVEGLESVKTRAKFTIGLGEKVVTPYGMGTVVEHRKHSKVIVVDMVGPWKARAFLMESAVTREGSGFFGSILRQFGSSSEKQMSPRKKSQPLEQQSHLAVGTTIHTIFGEGIVIQSKDPQSIPTFTSPSSRINISSQKPSERDGFNTVTISLNTWTMRDDKHPILYCTLDTIKDWKEKKLQGTPGHKRENSLFSVIGSLVSGTVQTLKKIRATRETEALTIVPREIETPSIKADAPRFERYYKNGAAVTTAYGDGVVCSFRDTDGFYTVSLMKYDKVFATAHLQEDCMGYRLAKGCIEGYPVLTKYGSGILHSVNPTTGVHNVTIPSFGAVLYLQPDQLIKPLKAAVGENVSTPYGEGIVLKYILPTDIYLIKLHWGNAILYATSCTFDRIDDRVEDRGGFGMSWILQFFYSREEKKIQEQQRSRSNSFSILSQSGISVKSLR